MSHPVITIFTRKNCGPCIGLMNGYQAFKNDVESICSDCKIHVISYDMDWKTRIFTEKYNIPDLINDAPGPNIDHLEFSPMIAVVRSDDIKDPEKYTLNGFKYSPEKRTFITDPSNREDLRKFLIRAIRKVQEMPQNQFNFSPIPPKTKGTKKEDISKRVEKVVAKSQKAPTKSQKSSSIVIVGHGNGIYGAKNGGKFHFEMVDTT